MDWESLRFCLGLRFQVTDEGVLSTAEAAWKAIFSALSPDATVGLRLFGFAAEQDRTYPQPSYICALTNMSLRQSRKVHKKLSESPRVCSLQTFYEPYLLKNQLELLHGYEFLGEAAESGEIEDGDVRYSDMCFTGSQTNKKHHSNVILLAPEMYCGWIPAETVARELMNSAAEKLITAQVVPFPIADSPVQIADKLILALGGRYTDCASDRSLLFSGVLPDRTAVLAAKTADEVKPHLQTAVASGYRSILIGLEEPLNDDIRASLVWELCESAADVKISVVDASIDAVSYLDQTAFGNYLRCADVVVGGDGACRLSDMTMELSRRCRESNKKFLQLSAVEEQPETAEQALQLLRADAKRLFETI